MNNPTPFTLPFSEITAADLSLVGDCSRDLELEANARSPSPPGFWLPTDASQAYTRSCPEAEELSALLDSAPREAVDAAGRAGARLRGARLELPVPRALAQTALASWR